MIKRIQALVYRGGGLNQRPSIIKSNIDTSISLISVIASISRNEFWDLTLAQIWFEVSYYLAKQSPQGHEWLI